MLYIVVALKSEVQAFVDKYKLTKTKLDNYILYSDTQRKIIISGIGVESARRATQTLINHFDITDDDIYLNIGIAAATSSYKIGSLLEIKEIIYEGIPHRFKEGKHSLVCVDTPQSNPKYEIVDMESYGFLDAVLHSPAIKNIYILKVVSDHFEPQKVTKEKTKSLLFNVINDINKILLP